VAESTEPPKKQVESVKTAERHGGMEEARVIRVNKTTASPPKASSEPAHREELRPLEISSQADLFATLAKAQTDEFLRHDVNKKGIRTRFTSGGRVTLRNGVGSITEYKMAILSVEYNFATKLMETTSCTSVSVVERNFEQGYLVGRYLYFAVPCAEDDARRWKELFKQNKLAVDVTFRIAGFRTLSQKAYSLAGDNDNTVVDARVLEGKFIALE